MILFPSLDPCSRYALRNLHVIHEWSIVIWIVVKLYLNIMLKRNSRNPISFSLLNSSQALNTWHLEAAVASILHLYPLIQQYFTIVLHNISSPLSSNPKIFQITLDLTTSTYPTLAMWLQTYYIPRDFYDEWFIASFLQSICNI